MNPGEELTQFEVLPVKPVILDGLSDMANLFFANVEEIDDIKTLPKEINTLICTVEADEGPFDGFIKVVWNPEKPVDKEYRSYDKAVVEWSNNLDTVTLHDVGAPSEIIFACLYCITKSAKKVYLCNDDNRTFVLV